MSLPEALILILAFDSHHSTTRAALHGQESAAAMWAKHQHRNRSMASSYRRGQRTGIQTRHTKAVSTLQCLMSQGSLPQTQQKCILCLGSTAHSKLSCRCPVACVCKQDSPSPISCRCTCRARKGWQQEMFSASGVVHVQMYSNNDSSALLKRAQSDALGCLHQEKTVLSQPYKQLHLDSAALPINEPFQKPWHGRHPMPTVLQESHKRLFNISANKLAVEVPQAKYQCTCQCFIHCSSLRKLLPSLL